MKMTVRKDDVRDGPGTTRDTLLEIRDLGKTYPDGTKALEQVDLELQKGELAAIIGLSGAGKSTFMRCINRLVEPTAGTISFNSRDVTRANRKQLRSFRREIGMVFQQFNLVQRHTAIQNVLHGRLGYTGTLRGMMGSFAQEEVDRAMDLLAQVGLEKQAYKRCTDLSGGQMQRVAIARAVMQEPQLILADEPIASLDVSASEKVMEILKEVATSDGIAVLVNLHQVDFAKEFADRIVGLRNGTKYCDVVNSELDDATVKEVYFGRVPTAGQDD